MINWIAATRPKTLLISLAPILIGGAYAFSQKAFNPLILLFIFLCAVTIQITANFANNYFDPFESINLSKESLKKGVLVAITLSILASIPLLIQGGALIAALEVASIALAIYYTKGHYSLARTGIADVTTLLFFGPIATGITAYLLIGRIDIAPFVLGLSPGLLSAAILNVNNIRDYGDDKIEGRRTVPIRVGLLKAKALYGSEILLALLLPPFVSIKYLPASLILLPSALLLIRGMEEGASYTRLLAHTAFFELALSLLMSACLFL